MSATGHERRRREAAAKAVVDALEGKDIAAFVKQEDVPCAPTLEALASYLPFHDRVHLDAMVERAKVAPKRRGRTKSAESEH